MGCGCQDCWRAKKLSKKGLTENQKDKAKEIIFTEKKSQKMKKNGEEWTDSRNPMKGTKKFRISKGEFVEDGFGVCGGCNKKFESLVRVEGNKTDTVCFDCFGSRFGAFELTDLMKRLSPDTLKRWQDPIMQVHNFVDFDELSVPQLIEERERIKLELDKDSSRLYDKISKEELDKLKHIDQKKKKQYLDHESTIGQVYTDTHAHLQHLMRERPYSLAIDNAQEEFNEYLDTITDENGYLDRDDALAYAKKTLNAIDRSDFGVGEAEGLDQFTDKIEQTIFNDKGTRKRFCPRCEKNELKYPLSLNAKSRYDKDTWVCSECGIAESLDGYDKALKMNKKTFQIFLDDVLPKDIPHENIDLITDWLMVQYLSKKPDPTFMKYFKECGGNLEQFNTLTEALQKGDEDYVNQFRKAIFNENIKALTAVGIEPISDGNVVYEKIVEDKLDSVMKRHSTKIKKEKKLDPKYISFEEAREWALDQKCHSRQDWINITKTDDFPDNIPIHPETKYAEFQELGGFPNFCGYTQKVRRASLTKERVKEILKEFERRWEFYAEYSTGMVTNWFDTQGLFSVKDPYVQTLLTKLTSWQLDPDSIEALRYWCRTGDFEKKIGKYSLQSKTEESTIDYLDRQPTQVKDMSITGLLEDSVTVGVERIMINARMVVPDETDKAWYDQQVVFCVRNIMLRFCDPDREEAEYKSLKAEPMNGNKFHDEILKTALKEYEYVKNINYDKQFYTFPHPPTFLQKYHAYKTREKNSFFNMSGTGQKKTGASVIGAIANKCTHILVVVPNNIVPQWVTNIRRFYSNAFVFSGKDLHNNYFINSGKHIPKFHVINYDKFGRSDLAKRFIDQIGSNKIDMVIFDEGQLVKTRDGDPNFYSNRRKNIETLVDHLRNVNRKLKVNILSATPVINNIREGKSLLELLTGTKYGFSTRNTLRNANKLHTEFIPFSVVYSKRPDLKEVGRDKPITVEAFLPEHLTDEEIMKLNWNELEQIATRYRIPKILEILNNSKGKTVIYTDYVTGIVSQLRKACIDAGYRVGEFTGDDKSGMIEKTGFQDQEGNDEVVNKFVHGDIDVLIASRPFQLGIDEVQFACPNLIFNGLVWTYAEFEQIIGRVSREGSHFDQVNIHVIMANINGYEYDRNIKYNRILKKRAIGDCVRYGTLPDELDIPDTKGERLRALKAMISNKESGFPEKELIEQRHQLEADQEIEVKIDELNEKFSEIEGEKKLGYPHR